MVNEEAWHVTLPGPVLSAAGDLMIAVDPGDVHCGVAFFEQVKTTGAKAKQWECVWTQEYYPDEWLDVLMRILVENRLRRLVYERWRLYADKASVQTGSEFVSTQVIGVMRWAVRKQNEHARLHVLYPPERLSCVVKDKTCTADYRPQSVDMIGQLADIKKPTQNILNYKKIRSLAAKMKTGQHCKDAEMHGWHWLLNGNPAHVEERPLLGVAKVSPKG